MISILSMLDFTVDGSRSTVIVDSFLRDPIAVVWCPRIGARRPCQVGRKASTWTTAQEQSRKRGNRKCFTQHQSYLAKMRVAE